MLTDAPKLFGWYSGLYLTFGLWTVHLLHLCRFRLIGWDKISAFPDWQISLHAAFWLGLLLLPLGALLVLFLNRYPRLVIGIMATVLYEIASECLGRSMFKVVGDLGIWATVMGGYALRLYYNSEVIALLHAKQLAAFHAEVLGVLRTVVNVCLFVIGTLGIAVTSNLISRYFDSPLGQGTAWVHVGTMLYLTLGMIFCVAQPLFRCVVAARARLSEA